MSQNKITDKFNSVMSFVSGSAIVYSNFETNGTIIPVAKWRVNTSSNYIPIEHKSAFPFTDVIKSGHRNSTADLIGFIPRNYNLQDQTGLNIDQYIGLWLTASKTEINNWFPTDKKNSVFSGIYFPKLLLTEFEFDVDADGSSIFKISGIGCYKFTNLNDRFVYKQGDN